MTEDLTWEYSKSPITDADIKRVEHEIGFQLPKEYIDIVKEHHGARPSKKLFNTQRTKGMMIKTFLPMTDEYRVNLLRVKDWINVPSIMIPFANTPNGDYLCFEYFSKDIGPAIVVWNHEMEVKEFVSISFVKFLEALYS